MVTFFEQIKYVNLLTNFMRKNLMFYKTMLHILYNLPTWILDISSTWSFYTAT